MPAKGNIIRISGPLVVAEGMKGAQMYETVLVGESKLIGEITRITGDRAYIQVYESTTGLKPGEPVEGTGGPLSVELGPGLIGNIYDGVQRPLPLIAAKIAETAPHRRMFVERGISVPPISHDKKWHFVPAGKPGVGDKVEGGTVIGSVKETELIEHRIMVPPGIRGEVKWIAPEGDYTIDEAIAEIETDGRRVPIRMHQRWPVRIPRPYKRKLEPSEPLITGTRIVDTLFPMAKGGTGAIPGGFGTGKCVLPGTPVLLGDGSLVPIEELFKRVKGSEPDPGLEEEIVDASKSDIRIVTFDGKGFRIQRISHVYKGRTDRIVVIRTANGREIKVTPAHRLFKLASGGAVVETPAIMIRKGDKILVPGVLPIEGSPQIIETYKLGRAKVVDTEVLAMLESWAKEHGTTIQADSVTLETLWDLYSSTGYKLPDKVVVEDEKGNRVVVWNVLGELLAELLGLFHGKTFVKGSRLLIKPSSLSGASKLAGLIREVFGVDVDLSSSVMSIESPVITGLLKLMDAVGEDGTIRPSRLLLKSPTSIVLAYLRGLLHGSGSQSYLGIVSFSSKEELQLVSYMLSRVGASYRVDGNRVVVTGLPGILAGPGFTASLPMGNQVSYDTVVDVDVVEQETVVYDVTVPETHNFVGGDLPTVLHNTVTLHSLAQWSAARVVIYIGCGERGNEMTEVLERFPKYKDPWTGKPLMERTILIANTSNMPVAAREASIYVGVTLAEYYRDMGYDVLLVADSTSRWAEALREIAGRLEEMPAEEGYPSYLASRLAEFYERAGRVEALGLPDRVGSVTIVGAVSPPGGDFTEPVTSHTRRFIRVFWALDTKLAYSRHYPAINWILSYSAYVDLVADWWHKNVDPQWKEVRDEAMRILLREDELQEIVRLVGTESLDERDKLVLETARLIKDGFLRQNAYDPIDAFSTPEKQFKLLKLFIDYYKAALNLVESGIPVSKIREHIGRLYVEMVKAKFEISNEELHKIEELRNRVIRELERLKTTYG